jgi:hypothetical protein
MTDIFFTVNNPTGSSCCDSGDQTADAPKQPFADFFDCLTHVMPPDIPAYDKKKVIQPLIYFNTF